MEKGSTVKQMWGSSMISAFLGGASSKEPTCQYWRHKRWGLGRSPGGGHGNPLQYTCLENPMDRGAWWATVHRVAESQACLKRLNTRTYTMISPEDNHYYIWTSCPLPPNLSGILLASIKSLWQWERCFEWLGISLALTGQEALALKLLSWLTHGLLLELWTSYLTLILVFPSDNEPNAWLWGESLSAWGIICCVKEDSQLEAINSSKLSKEYLGSRLQHIWDNSIFTKAISINHLLMALPTEAIK